MVTVPAKDQFYKTKLCPHHQGAGCRNKGDCFFAHGETELRHAPDLRKTKLCREFMKSGSCERGDECVYAHSERELRGTDGYWKTDLCKYWKSGGCTAGYYCRHAHGPEELQPRKYKNEGFDQKGDETTGSLSLRHSNNKQKNFSGYLTPQARTGFSRPGLPPYRFVMTPLNKCDQAIKSFGLQQINFRDEIGKTQTNGSAEQSAAPQQICRPGHHKILFVCKEDGEDDDDLGRFSPNVNLLRVPVTDMSFNSGDDPGSSYTVLEDAVDEMLDGRCRQTPHQCSVTDVGSTCANIPTDGVCHPASVPSPLPPYTSLAHLPLSKRPSLSVPSPSITSFSKNSKLPFIPPPPKFIPPPPASIPPPPPSPNSLVPASSLVRKTVHSPPPPPPSVSGELKCERLPRSLSSTVCTTVPSRSTSIASSRGHLSSPPPPPPLERTFKSPPSTRTTSPLTTSNSLRAPLSPPAPPPLSPPSMEIAYEKQAHSIPWESKLVHLEGEVPGMYWSYLTLGVDPKGNMLYMPVSWRLRNSGVPMDLQAKFSAITPENLVEGMRTVVYVD